MHHVLHGLSVRRLAIITSSPSVADMTVLGRVGSQGGEAEAGRSGEHIGVHDWTGQWWANGACSAACWLLSGGRPSGMSSQTPSSLRDASPLMTTTALQQSQVQGPIAMHATWLSLALERFQQYLD